MKKKFLVLLLLIASPSFAQTISDLPPITVDGIADKADVKFGVDDSAAGASKRIDIAQVGQVVTTYRITATSHGLVAGDIGKPLYGTAVWDDTVETEHPDWILVQIPDANTLRVMPTGGSVTISNTLLNNGASYNIATAGRHLYWDEDEAKYYGHLEGTAEVSNGDSRYVLTLLSVDSTTFTAIVAIRPPDLLTRDVIVRGTGVAAVDDVRMAEAAATLQSQGGGCLKIVGTVQLANNYNFTTPVSVVGVVGTDPIVEFTGSSGQFAWHGSYGPDWGAGTSINAANARASDLEVPTGSLSAGDWFLVCSDDNISGITSIVGWNHRPLEMHQVKEIRGTTGGIDYIVFDDFVIDALTTNPRIYPLTDVLEGVEIRDLTFTRTRDSTSILPCLNIRKCVDLHIENVNYKEPAPNSILVYYCANVTIDCCTFEPSDRYEEDEGYGLVVGPVNNFVFSNSVMAGYRHCFTTGGATGVGAVRYGTPRNMILDNIVAKITGKPNPGGGLVAFDTHAEGWGIIFQDCKAVLASDKYDPVNVTSANANIGFQARARNTIFKNCAVSGDFGAWGYRLAAEGCKVLNCSVEESWMGVRIYRAGSQTDSVDGCVVDGFTMRNNPNGHGVRIEDGDNHVITNVQVKNADTGIRILQNLETPSDIKISRCSFEDCSDTGISLEEGNNIRVSFVDFDNCGTTDKDSLIWIDTATSISVDFCNMAKGGNVFSVGGSYGTADLSMTGNNLRGYTGDINSTDVGLDPANLDAGTMTSDFQKFNFSDPGLQPYVP